MFAAAGIGVDLLDQLGHAVDAVAEDLGGLAAGGSHYPIAHHQQAIVVSGGELLDQHRGAFLPRRFVGRDDLLAGREVGGHAATLVPVLRLDDHRHADLGGRSPGVLGVLHRPAARRRYAHGAEQHAGHFLVLGNRFRDGTGAVRLGRLNPALFPAVTEQDQALGIQPPVGDVAGRGRFDDGPGARPEAHLLGQITKPLDLLGNVPWPVINGGQAQPPGDGHALAAQRLLGILDDNLIDALLGGLAGLAEADFRARQRLQFQRDVFENMAQVRAVAQALKEAAALSDAATVLDHARQPTHQAIVQARKLRGGSIQVVQVEPHFEHGKVRPDVRPPKRQYLAEFHRCLSLHNVTSRLQQNRSNLPKTIYAANSQMVVSTGFAKPITTRITSKKERNSFRSAKYHPKAVTSRESRHSAKSRITTTRIPVQTPGLTPFAANLPPRRHLPQERRLRA